MIDEHTDTQHAQVLCPSCGLHVTINLKITSWRGNALDYIADLRSLEWHLTVEEPVCTTLSAMGIDPSTVLEDGLTIDGDQLTYRVYLVPPRTDAARENILYSTHRVTVPAPIIKEYWRLAHHGQEMLDIAKEAA